MTVETFQKIANKTLVEYTKNRREKYGWTHWNPAQTPDTNTVITFYEARLWKDNETNIIDLMAIDKTLNEEDTVAEITRWLDENLAKFKS